LQGFHSELNPQLINFPFLPINKGQGHSNNKLLGKIMNDRRRYFRLPTTLPLDISLPGLSSKRICRMSSNVSAGGIYFHTSPEDHVTAGQTIALRIPVPPAVGRSLEQTVLQGRATVLRVEKADSDIPAGQLGVACAFTEPLRFA
jgi:hypothetical protein